MSDYQFYAFNREGHVALSEFSRFDRADEAARHAAVLNQDYTRVEVWEGWKCVYETTALQARERPTVRLSEEYQRKAEEAEKHARCSKSRMKREAYEQIATAWRQLQEGAERQARARVHWAKLRSFLHDCGT